MAVNGVAVSKMSHDVAIKSIVSAASGPVLLTVDRAGQRLDFRVNRMRESDLAALSHERYAHWYEIDDDRPVLVPATETAEELADLEAFRQERLRKLGFKWSHGMLVPAQTPETDVVRLVRWTSGVGASARFQMETEAYPEPGKFGPGLSLVILKAPAEIAVGQVLPASPAFRAGALPGDDVAEIDGHEATSLTAQQLTSLLQRPSAADEVSIRVKRGSLQIPMRLSLEDGTSLEDSDPDADIPRHPGGITAGHDFIDLGLKVLYDSGSRRAVVDKLTYPSPAFNAGLELGDELLAVNGKQINELTQTQISNLLAPSNLTAVNVAILRANKRLTFEIKPELWSQALAVIGRRITEHGVVPEKCP